MLKYNKLIKNLFINRSIYLILKETICTDKKIKFLNCSFNYKLQFQTCTKIFLNIQFIPKLESTLMSSNSHLLVAS